MVDQIFAATRYGLEYERLRLEAASHNIAVANTPSDSSRSSQLMRVSTTFLPHVGVQGADAGHWPRAMLVGTQAAERKVHDPSDPAADKDGMVSYPKVDMVQEMSELMDASRAYEANVRAFNTLRGMALHALDLGGGA
ncbi:MULTISPECIES: flagellar basal body rod protein FlgC [Dyella]|uniref:flagellar basal body rod protein FlgC n=1 Tax=Dyella TaxID=231454 RepID=UPI000CA82AF6|nr:MULTISPECIES: flagellar basal body rod C-terminal domain-containing protein [Dyella]MDR3443743.1 flagellar basal body rod C-terminal domain-containing protein [Dyella sp.]PMQ04550.1 Flagellar basal-body rod protein FlgC [Dyella sp. AD56]ULU23708.1 lagellar basal body rod FlgEFG protein [Dyella terrae]